MSANIRGDCGICCFTFSETRTAASLGCGHIFCKVCLYTLLNEKPQCPHCKKDFTMGDIRTLHAEPVPPTPDVPIDSPLTSYSFQIFVKDLQDKSRTISVTKDEDILTLKGKIQEKTGVPVEFQRLIYGGKPLRDEHRLSEYNVRPNSTIHLVDRLLGGF